ncbi:MAG: TRAP transporter large permease [Rhodospirillaceae bacterium]|nr:TRAP transporter large permease [Rhodospirillaceae bacterium]
MTALEIGGLGILALFGLMLLQVPIGFAMIIVGVVGFGLQAGWHPALTLLVNEPSGILSSADLATVPLFLLMGTFASVAGFSTDLYNAASAFLGHRRGGLAYATIGGSAAFGVVCGSSTATAATFARAALPEMLKRGYSDGFSAGTIAAGGTLKSLIPPSIVMILYCIVAKTFILDIFRAAIVPAILTIAVNLLTIYVMVRVSKGAAPVGERVPWRERWQALRGAAPVLFLMVAVFGGLYSGVFTVTEAASVAAVLSLVFALARGRLNWALTWQGLRESAAATGMIYVMIMGALIFTYFLNLARVPDALVDAIAHMQLPPLAIIFVLLVAYLALGAVFDEISAMLITLPLVLPVIQKLGATMMPDYSPEMVAVWWGIINVVIIELGMIIPPIGIIVFILHGLAPNIPIGRIYSGVTPFIVADLLLLAALTVFPAIALWLPQLWPS